MGNLVADWLSCPSCEHHGYTEEASPTVQHDGEHLILSCEWCDTTLKVWNGDRAVLGSGKWPSDRERS